MAELQIFNLDSDSNPISTLQAGEYIFGRGPLLKCNDRRVSRKHGVINVTDKAATITSTHQNPCFYQAANSSTITILPKDIPVDISDGDKFALLADQFWFRIKLVKNGSNEAVESNGSSSPILNSTSNCNENGNLSPLFYTSFPQSTSTSNAIENENLHDNSDYLQITQTVNPSTSTTKSKKIDPELNDGNAETSSDSIDFLQTAQKRTFEGDAESPNKKAKVDNENVEKSNEENELLSVLGDLKRKEAISDSEGEESNKEEAKLKSADQANKELLSELEGEDNGKKDISAPKTNNKEVMSESEDDTKAKHNIPKPNPSRGKKGNVSLSSAQSARDAELKAMLFSSDDDDDEQKEVKAAVNNETKVSSSSKDVNMGFNPTNNEGDTKKNKTPNKRKKRNSDDGKKDDKTDQDPNVAGTSSSNGKKEYRDRCWYGLNCYRKSGAHLSEYCHPGDSDYATDPEDDRPTCAFGAACYRRNKDHRQNYKHPNNPQKPPGKKTKKKNNTGAVPKKRTSKKNYAESSEDDYDLDDPFIASETEYEATTSDEDDSDSDWSEDSEGETKRMLKEAKKFTRGKKKDKGGDNDDD